jgi:hypothetical protein
MQAVRFEARGGASTPRRPKQLDRVVRPLLLACGALDGDDPLLRAQRDSCAALARYLRSASKVGGCKGTETCGNLVRAMRSAVRGMTKFDRRADRVIHATTLDAACKRSLLGTRRGYRDLHRLDRALTRLIRAIEAHLSGRVVTAGVALGRLDSGDRTSSRRLLRRFRAACR